jgi:glycolate oxidase FAD binding subunit
VVKNVTGYDLMKLHTGACGTLGVIEAAWIRLRARPPETALVAGFAPAGEPGFAAALGAARHASARAVALVDGALAPALGIPIDGEVRPLLLAELGGVPGELRRAREALARPLEMLPAPADAVERLRARLARLGADGLRFRIAALPGRLAAAAAPLAAAGAALLSFPGVALLWAGFPPGTPAQVEAAWAAARAGARAGGGSFALEAGPLAAKRGHDVFGEPGEALSLTRALKTRFDPRGVLNPTARPAARRRRRGGAST